jgi:MFS transporter, ACS family, aldohexuronate transporter
MVQSSPSTAVGVTSAVSGSERAGSSAYIWVVLGVSLLVQTTASFGNQGISPLAPFLTADLGFSKSQVGLVLTGFYVGGILLMTAAGAACDRLGVRRMFLFGLLGCAAPLLLAAQALGLPLLVGAMFLAGLGNAIALPATTRAIVDWFPTRHRGLAMGVKQTGVALAGMIMGPVVPLLALFWGWRGALDAIGWFSIGAAALSWLVYREQGGERPGPAGPRPPGLGVRTLLANRNLTLLSATSFCLAAAQLSITTFMVLYLHERLHFDVGYAGLVLAITQAGGIVGRIGWGLVSDAYFGGRRKTEMLIITTGASLSAFGLALLQPGLPEWLLWALLFVTGLTAVGWNGINMIFVAEMAGRQASATAAALNLTSSYIGIIFGPPLFGLLIDSAGGSYTPAFTAAGCIATVAILLVSRIQIAERSAG